MENITPSVSGGAQRPLERGGGATSKFHIGYIQANQGNNCCNQERPVLAPEAPNCNCCPCKPRPSKSLFGLLFTKNFFK